MFIYIMILMSSTEGSRSTEVITPKSDRVFALEGDNVTLSCNYSGSVRGVHWYRQYADSPPQFLILEDSSVITRADPPVPRITINHRKEQSHVDLEISSAAVSDSALYYCALRNDGGGRKIIFGQGTTLRVESKETKAPEFYRFGQSCLATDFTNHSHVNSLDFTPVRYSGKNYENYYSGFALDIPDARCEETGDCKGKSSGQSDMEFDEKINFMSLGLFWLRILLLKTVVFNILMTFKAWMS